MGAPVSALAPRSAAGVGGWRLRRPQATLRTSVALNLRDGYELKQAKPLALRYGFHARRGAVDAAEAAKRQKAFAAAPAWKVVKAERPWRVKLRRAEE